MKRWKVIIAAVLIFATGVVTGALGLKAVTESNRPSRDRGFGSSLMDPRFDAVQRMQRELTLTPDQTRSIESILQESRKRTRQIWETFQPQMREEMKQVRERIQTVLLPDQREKFDELMKRSRERHPRPPDGGGDPRGPWPRHGDPGARGERGTNAPPGAAAPSPQ